MTCPVNSRLNAATRNCDCVEGFFTNQFGICTEKCGTNEVYDPATQRCSCIKGLGRISGRCTVCPTGTQPTADGSSCSNCGLNEELSSGQCICKTGFARNSAQVCTACNELPNGFLINGLCSICPKSTIVIDGRRCGCPQGKILQGSTCVSQCQNDELLDAEGNCYTCGSNMVISNGACVCATGYALNNCGVCALACGSGQFPYQGGCAICPLNTIYKPEINGCDCPAGYYKDNFGVCQKLVLKPVNCPQGEYFDQVLGCVACPGSCKTCSSASICLSCASTGYEPNSVGVCVTKCGDGIILGSEACDSGNVNSPGCVNCQVTAGWICSGQPSVCRQPQVIPPPQNNPTPVTPVVTPSVPNVTPISTKPRLYQSGKANVNTNNVFITLMTNPTFTFTSELDRQNFIKASFPSGAKPTVYCSQRPSPNLDTFDCLLIYASGVPLGLFNVDFSYNKDGISGQVTVQVDPFAVSNSRRARAGQ